MSPARRRHIALCSALGAVSLLLYCYPLLLYLTLFFLFLVTVLYFRGPESLPARLGLNPRTAVNIQTELRRWVWAWGVGGTPEGQRKFNSGKTKLSPREPAHRGPYRHEALGSESLLFSPRDLLMGSYIHKAESPPGDGSLRPRATRNPREELRDRLARPNYAVYTPNRRLSFSGEPLGTGARFTITPQRHYPLQQQGTSPVGVLPPLRWDGFRQKSVLSPRNSSLSSPVTVKIARPDGHAHGLEHVCSPVLPGVEADPCSRESVLKVLKESRKREVEEERSLVEQQRSKRRRNDSGGSAQSAFEPLLPNGTSPQLIPKPGTLKRGLTAAAEEQSLKRSRTSSVSSSSGAATFRGTPSSRRNPIASSYSSTLGLSQRKRPLASASPRSSPGPSRSHTPECSSKKIREEEQKSPSPAPCVPSVSASGQLPALEESTSPKEPAVSSTERTQSGGKRRRKIQLVSRDDHLSLPPPPELGYSITVEDLDEEKRSALSKIQKLLETPAPEPAATSVPSITSSSTGPLTAGLTFTAGTLGTSSASSAVAPSSSTSAPTTSAGTVAGVLGASSGTVAGVLGASSGTLAGVLGASSGTLAGILGASSGTVGSALGVSPATAPGSTVPPETNLLLESLKRKSASPVTAAVTASAPVQPVLSLQTSAPSASSSAAPPSTATSVQPPAPSLFNAPAATAAPAPAPSASASLLAPGFKPVFNVTSSSTVSAADNKPLQNFKPIFGAAPSASSSAATVSTPSAFGGSGSGALASLFPPSTASGSAPVSSGGGELVTTVNFSSGSGSSLPSYTQAASAQSTSTATFGGFGASTTAAQSALTFGTATTTAQSPPTFGTATTASPALTFGSTFGSTTSSQSASTFGATTTAAPPAFTFGAATTSSQSAPTFGTTTTTAAPPAFTFGAATTSSQSAPTFGTTTATTAPPAFTFGAATTSSQSAPTFGTTTTTAAPPALTFGATTSSRPAATFGATTAAPSAQTFGATTSSQPAATFGATTAAPSAQTFGATTSSQPAATFGATTAAPSALTFGATTSSQSAPTFGATTAAPPAPTFGATTSQSTFTFGKSTLETSSTQPSFSAAAEPPKPFTFGALPPAQSSQTAAPALNPAAPTTAPSFGTLTKPAFSFGASTAAAPSFGAEAAAPSSSTFTFGSSAPQAAPANAQPSTPFKFGAAPTTQFGTPVNNAAPQMGGFAFGTATADKPAFGTPTPVFGQTSTPAPIPFGSPGTPAPSFNAPPFGSPATPSFSIGAGSKPSATRQRLQARRQHTRKK